MVAIFKTLVLATAVAISISALSPAQAGPIVGPATAVAIKQHQECSVSKSCGAELLPAQQAPGVSIQERSDKGDDIDKVVDEMKSRWDDLMKELKEHYDKNTLIPPIKIFAKISELLQEMKEKQLDMGDAIVGGLAQLPERIRRIVCFALRPVLRTWGVEC
ncbi:hypothetical protein BGZ49_008854 [Haplosporangium sp. Z 27]|nr:hypothetical protein BGZ49_008854 [Haplosporangium sp. Z 27]